MILKSFLTYKVETVGIAHCSNLNDEMPKETNNKEYLSIVIVRSIFLKYFFSQIINKQKTILH